MATKAQIKARIDAAQGRVPCDLILRGVKFLDVFSAAWREGDVAVAGGTIVGVEPGLEATREEEARGKYLVPGFIDAHVHLESSMLLPHHFQAAVLPRGTTTAICDPHELANVMGVAGISYFLEAAEGLALDLRVMLSSCVPATDFETNGAGHLKVESLSALRPHPKALGLAEMMNVPGVLFNSDEVIDKITAFSDGVMDGHCPLASGQALSAYAAAGISSCHESTQLAEAQEKLTKGISVWIREGSVAKDLHALAPLLTLATSTSVGFCTDDRNPLDIATEGHVDYLVREAIRLGCAPEVAYRAASWSVARHYGLKRTGAIAPGYVADFILLDDMKTCAIRKVYKAGRPVEECEARATSTAFAENTIRATLPHDADLEGPVGNVHVIEVEAGKILTGRRVSPSSARGVHKLAVLERYGRGSKPANGYVAGFGENFNGAIASSVGHDSHNLIAVGSNAADMRVAMNALKECGGGYCVVAGGQVRARLPLPVGGLMSRDTAGDLEKSLRTMREASRDVGCPLPEPFLQLAFLSLPVIPSLKLTDRGLVDVDKFEIIPVRAT